MSNSVIITFIRHAESTFLVTGDRPCIMYCPGIKSIQKKKMLNLLTIIGRCGPDGKTHLSLITQARTLGVKLADTHFTAIYTSDLKRASATAQAVYDHQKDPKPSFDSSDLFREQNVGLAEGHPMSFNVISSSLSWEEHAARGVYLACYSDDDRFPEGESIKDLAKRARAGLEKFVLPHVLRAAKEGKTGIHVAVVSHGLCITELVSELLKKSAKKVTQCGVNLFNTGWIRVVVDIEGAEEGQPIDVDNEPPVLAMRVTEIEGRKPDYY